MEACAGAHHWARRLEELGHEVRLIPPVYVKPFVKRQKNDAADAEAIAEAASRPTMRYATRKTPEQQALCVVFRTRDMLVRQRTQTINALRGHLGEFGIIAPKGIWNVGPLARALDENRTALPSSVVEMADIMLEQIARLSATIVRLSGQLRSAARVDDQAARLMTIPGVGPICASAVQAFAPRAAGLASGRDFSAWLGLTPRQRSTGGRAQLGKTSKMGQRDLMRLLIAGAWSVIIAALRKGPPKGSWLERMLTRKPKMLVAVALANKMARIVWALLRSGESYRNPVVRAA
jgi:transposase